MTANASAGMAYGSKDDKIKQLFDEGFEQLPDIELIHKWTDSCTCSYDCILDTHLCT